MTSIFRDELPQRRRPFLTDGGIETTLIFQDGIELPDFASFVLHTRPGGEAALTRYFTAYADLARQSRAGLVLESATWRASADWGERLGYSGEALADVNRRAVAFLEAVRAGYEQETTPIVISGCIGPRGDGYQPGMLMSEGDAARYHAAQVDTFAATAADLVTALTMNYVEEAVGITRAAKRAGMPVVISFTVETDGALATGQPLGDAIEQVDAVTDAYPAYYMINCAHPVHIDPAVAVAGAWTERVGGLRANASAKSHAELNESTTLDEGDPEQLAADYARLLGRLKRLSVLGGCCGTDHRHVQRIADVCLPLMKTAG